ncbi:MAG: hypothetical protein H6620_09335 [Halobacteriovoraceae bacterium]|nr:hypothetical protein [Halobacteriovoraceae bacterium]
MSFIISYESWTNYYTAIFVVFKFLQGIPAGGEIPGAICYLHESSTTSKQPWLSKRFMCSYTLFGPQIGLAMSAVVCLILKAEFPLELLKEHGWRYVFSISGSLGIIGVVIRKKLHETIKFLEYKSDHKVLHHPVRTLFSKNFHRVKLGFVLSIFEVVAFSVLSLVPFYFVNPPFELDSISILYLSLGFSGINVILLPTIGFLSSRKMNFPWIKISIWGTIAFSPILLISIMIGNIIFSLIISFFLLFFLNIQAAILPSIIAEIFPIRLRYSGRH